MEERRRKHPRHTSQAPRKSRSARRRRRRYNPGFVLNAVCIAIIVVCLCIGGVQSLARQKAEKAEAEQKAAEEAALREEQQKAAEEAAAAEAAKYDFTLSFMGDVNLDDSWDTMTYLNSQTGSVTDIFDADLLSLMQNADLFCVNSEFAFTEGGEALDGKAYTFRSKPSNVSLYQDMGVDLVTLANNHVYDFGAQGLTDTLATLDNAAIAHVGAGETLTDASAPYYWEKDGQTVAFVNASCAEQNRYTPEATESSSGILLCYETDKFVQAIREAKNNADYVVALVHWGTDYEYVTSDSQRSTAREYIDAGADVIIGTHSHCLQGIEYYDGKPVFYSLGTCWFNSKTLETFMLQLHFTGDGNGGEVSAAVVPAIQRNCTTHLTQSQEEWDQVVNLILEYSTDVSIDSTGLVTQASAASADTGDAAGTAEDAEAGSTGTASAEETGDASAAGESEETGADSAESDTAQDGTEDAVG